MAWVEGESWELEQGIDGLKVFELFSDAAQVTPWQFVGWDVNATISDEKGRSVFAVVIDAQPTEGRVKLIAPETLVNGLKVGGNYRYDVLMVPPGVAVADDHYLATGPVSVALRTSRRDAP